MKTPFYKVKGVEDGINFDAYYTVDEWGKGIAFYLLGWAIKITSDNDEEPEEIPDHDYVVAVMVGDDKRHLVSPSDLIMIREDSFCRSCGQVGCCHNVYE